MGFYLGLGSDDPNDNTLRGPIKKDEMKALIASSNFTFVSDVAGVAGSGGTNTAHKANMLVSDMLKNINDGVFEGTITLMGDPFYLFDAKLQPFQYFIKVVILRPGPIDESNGSYELEASYLSGSYYVKKIRHTIDIGGYTTELDVSKWPT